MGTGRQLVSRLALAGAMLGILGASPAGAAAVTRHFHDWLVACGDVSAAGCAASTYVVNPDAAAGAAARLRISSDGADLPFEMTLLPTSRFVDVSRPMTVRVDDKAVSSLAPGEGYREVNEHEYRVLTREVIDALLPQMKAGSWLLFTYTDQHGGEARVSFSQVGVTAALDFMESFQLRVGRTAADPGQYVPAELACSGNEPFWDLTIRGSVARYSMLTSVMERNEAELLGGYNRIPDPLQAQFVWRGRADRGKGDVVAFIARKRCRDTMSDREGVTDHPYAIRVSMPTGSVLSGCCSPGAGAGRRTPTVSLEELPVADLTGKPHDDWSRLLVDLKPAIDVCVAKTSGSGVRVARAWPMNHGKVGVRTRNGEGGWWDCIAAADGSGVDTFEEVPPGMRTLPGESHAMFTPAGAYPPAGRCFEHQRVLDETGKLLGWLSYNHC